jgi:hypothetical protein
MRHWLSAIIVAAGIIGFVSPSAAKVIKFEIVRVESPAFEGRSFGAVGTYDRIVAQATIAVPPADPHNTVIVDLDRAPRNAQGLVEAVTDVEILRPTVAANGNFGEGELCDNNGAMIPFAATREERLKNNDPRLSMAERYPSEGDRAAAIAKAAQQLVQDRLLLEDDAKLFAPKIN